MDSEHARGLRVKPLEWKQDGDYITSDHAFGFYEIIEVDGHILSRDGVDTGMFSTFEAAKAAAQADYEARIMSALAALPAPDEGEQGGEA